MPTPSLSRDLRVWANATPNALTVAVAARRGAGHDVIDLAGASAHENGLGVSEARLAALATAAAERAARAHPDPRGQRDAREAVAAFYARRGLPTDAADIILTPGTSLAYLYLLRLLCNPGDEVLVPRPGYPLFDDLCRFAGARQRYYHLARDGGRWRLDLDDLAFQCTPRTRLVMLVSPHNPLGLVASPSDLAALSELCARNGLALVFDEVFSEFAAAPLPRPTGGPLTILLNGFSKMLSLPGLKLGWMRVSPPGAPLTEALEYVSDLFLPVSEISQAMTAPLLSMADEVSAATAAALRRRRGLVEGLLGRPVVPADGGVYVCVPVDDDDDTVALRALDAGVLVHPGHLYALEGHLVFTCVAAEERLAEGIRRLRTVLT